MLFRSQEALQIAAGMIIMFFEFVEAQVIGSPAGIAQTLQIFYFGLGTLIVAATMLKMFLETLSDWSPASSMASNSGRVIISASKWAE